ncbi:unnamed protein product [Anisakis simplex]|uniref:UNC93-like protein MFSD11 n=1 Tax=Anisakis simplex TaxID=6269 RepID=A0A0M3K911_ANISI|nr:unnamed protein product [Anisakis simplex]
MVCIEYKTRNVIHLAFGFICVFFAFNSQGFIEPTVLYSASKDGVVHEQSGSSINSNASFSLAIIYAFAMAANLVVAPIIDFIGAKWSMVLGGLTYTLFQVGMLFLNEPYLYFSSALLGVGSAFIWTGQGKYLTMNSTKETAPRNSGLLWGLLQSSLLGGGIFLFGIFSGMKQETINTETRMIIYGVFAGVSLVGNLLHLILPTKGLIDEQADDRQQMSQWRLLWGACFGLMGDKFRRFGRIPIILVGFVTHIICFILTYINFPPTSNIAETYESAIIQPNIALALVVGGLLGFGDACWNTQLYSILIDVYHDQAAQGFSIMKFIQAAFACASFFYTPSTRLPIILLILVIFLVLSTVSFIYVENVTSHHLNKTKTKSKTNEIEVSQLEDDATTNTNDTNRMHNDSATDT